MFNKLRYLFEPNRLVLQGELDRELLESLLVHEDQNAFWVSWVKSKDLAWHRLRRMVVVLLKATNASQLAALRKNEVVPIFWVDVQNLSVMDCTGIAVLLYLLELIQDQRGYTQLCGFSSQLSAWVRLYHLDPFFLPFLQADHAAK